MSSSKWVGEPDYGAYLGSGDVLMLCHMIVVFVCLFVARVMFIVLIALCCIDDVVAIESNCETLLLCSAE